MDGIFAHQPSLQENPNSLLATEIWLARAYASCFPDTDTNLWWPDTHGMRLDGFVYWEAVCAEQLKARYTRETRR